MSADGWPLVSGPSHRLKHLQARKRNKESFPPSSSSPLDGKQKKDISHRRGRGHPSSCIAGCRAYKKGGNSSNSSAIFCYTRQMLKRIKKPFPHMQCVKAAFSRFRSPSVRGDGRSHHSVTMSSRIFLLSVHPKFDCGVRCSLCTVKRERERVKSGTVVCQRILRIPPSKDSHRYSIPVWNYLTLRFIQFDHLSSALCFDMHADLTDLSVLLHLARKATMMRVSERILVARRRRRIRRRGKKKTFTIRKWKVFFFLSYVFKEKGHTHKYSRRDSDLREGGEKRERAFSPYMYCALMAVQGCHSASTEWSSNSRPWRQIGLCFFFPRSSGVKERNSKKNQSVYFICMYISKILFVFIGQRESRRTKEKNRERIPLLAAWNNRCAFHGGREGEREREKKGLLRRESPWANLTERGDGGGAYDDRANLLLLSRTRYLSVSLRPLNGEEEFCLLLSKIVTAIFDFFFFF